MPQKKSHEERQRKMLAALKSTEEFINKKSYMERFKVRREGKYGKKSKSFSPRRPLSKKKELQ